MKRILGIITLALFAIATPAQFSPPVHTGKALVKLEWDHPDSSVSFKVYSGQVEGAYESIHTAPPGQLFTEIEVSAHEDTFFVVTAVDAAGLESGPSNVVVNSATPRPPEAPGFLRIVERTTVENTTKVTVERP